MTPKPHTLPPAIIVLGLFTYFLFTTSDSMSRLLLQRGVDMYQVAAMVMGLALVPILGLIGFEKSWKKLKPRHLRLVALAVGLCCIEISACFYAFAHLDHLVEAYALFFTMPLWTALLAALLLKEHLSRQQLGAILLGFAGVIIANWPQEGTTPLGWGHIAGLAAPFLASIRILITRQLAGRDGGSSLLLYMFAGLTAFSLANIGTFTPLSGSLLAFVLLAGMAQGGAHVCFLLMARRTPAPLLAPFQYSQVLWSTIFGILIFAEWPALTTYAGMALVVAGGFILMRKNRES